MPLIYIGILSFVIWLILYIGLKIIKWVVHILLVLAIVSAVIWLTFGGQGRTYTVPVINQTITI